MPRLVGAQLGLGSRELRALEAVGELGAGGLEQVLRVSQADHAGEVLAGGGRGGQVLHHVGHVQLGEHLGSLPLLTLNHYPN